MRRSAIVAHKPSSRKTSQRGIVKRDGDFGREYHDNGTSGPCGASQRKTRHGEALSIPNRSFAASLSDWNLADQPFVSHVLKQYEHKALRKGSSRSHFMETCMGTLQFQALLLTVTLGSTLQPAQKWDPNTQKSTSWSGIALKEFNVPTTSGLTRSGWHVEQPHGNRHIFFLTHSGVLAAIATVPRSAAVRLQERCVQLIA
jgi:hypothetical protein